MMVDDQKWAFILPNRNFRATIEMMRHIFNDASMSNILLPFKSIFQNTVPFLNCNDAELDGKLQCSSEQNVKSQNSEL